jgi:endonuclease III
METQAELTRTSQKRPFDIPDMLARIEQAIKPFPKAMLFELYDRGYKTPFEILVACMISIRTRDETSLEVSLRLFEKARLPYEVAAIPRGELAKLLKPATYPDQKAERILRVAQFADRSYHGNLPCDENVLTALPGVGPKTANLVLGIACGKAAIGVDIHVQRVTNRWGYVEGGSPNATEYQLQRKLPKEYWVKINALLVPFGKHICVGRRPYCSRCPVLNYCRQVGVINPR